MNKWLVFKGATAKVESVRYWAFLSMAALLALFVYFERGKLTYPHFWIVFILTCLFGATMSVVRNISQEKDFNHLLTLLYVPLIYLLIFYSGGAQSNLFPLFFFVLVRGALIDRYRGSFVGAALVSVLYGIFLLTTMAEGQEYTTIVGRIALLWALAILFGNMGDRVKGAEDKIIANNVQLKGLITELEDKNEELSTLQEDLITAKRLEALNRVASIMIHDLKNTTSQLSLLVQNMESHNKSQDFKEETMRIISDTVGDMTAMITRLQNRPQSIELGMVQEDLNEIIGRALRESGVRENGAITIVEDYDELPLVCVDEVGIEKVMINLINNALDAVKEGETPDARLILRSRQAENGEDSKEVIAEVSDNGCGMSQDFLKNRLFKPFETTKANGFGLGTYSCQEIVRAHGGSIEAMSELGVGSTFIVRLPVEEEKSEIQNSAIINLQSAMRTRWTKY